MANRGSYFESFPVWSAAYMLSVLILLNGEIQGAFAAESYIVRAHNHLFNSSTGQLMILDASSPIVLTSNGGLQVQTSNYSEVKNTSSGERRTLSLERWKQTLMSDNPQRFQIEQRFGDEDEKDPLRICMSVEGDTKSGTVLPLNMCPDHSTTNLWFEFVEIKKINDHSEIKNFDGSTELKTPSFPDISARHNCNPTNASASDSEILATDVPVMIKPVSAVDSNNDICLSASKIPKVNVTLEPCDETDQNQRFFVNVTSFVRIWGH